MAYEQRKNARRILWQWGNTLNRIARLERERKAARQWADDAADTLKGVSYDVDGGGRSSRKHDLSDVIETVMRRKAQYDELVANIDAEISEAIRLRAAVEDLIAELTPIQEKVITYRYIDGHSWQYIAMKLNYDISWVKRIEGEAADIVGKRISVSH